MAKEKKVIYRNPAEPVPEKKQIPWLLIAIISLSLVAVILGTVFISSFFGVMHFKSSNQGETIYNPRTRITYQIAPMCYQPVTILNKDPYGKLGKKEFYALKGQSPKDILTTDEDDIYDIYYNVKKPLPTLDKFDVVGCYVCEVGLIAIPILKTEKADAQKAAELILNGEKVEQPTDIENDSVLYLYFVSEKNPHIYYYITYFKTKEGKRYLMDRSFGRCVEIGTELDNILN